MIRRGPKTQAAYRADSAVIPGAREPAPPDMEPAAAVFWEAIVNRLPADFFPSETIPLLKGYCRHACYADKFAREIVEQREALAQLVAAGVNDDDIDTIKLLAKLRVSLLELHKLHGAETDHAASLATKLRLTNQSRYVPDRAASKSRAAAPAGLPPWHDWGTPADTEN
jgi:hypothetical protein